MSGAPDDGTLGKLQSDGDVAKEHGHEAVLEALAQAGTSAVVAGQHTRWTPTEQARPVEGRACVVITEGGDERELVFQSNLWFLPDRSMYVYFTPVFWRYAED